MLEEAKQAAKDPKKAAPPPAKAPAAGKDKGKGEQEPIETGPTGPKYKFGKFKQDGLKGDAGTLLRPHEVYCHAYFIWSLYCSKPNSKLSKNLEKNIVTNSVVCAYVGTSKVWVFNF